jgi:hypothetical protein
MLSSKVLTVVKTKNIRKLRSGTVVGYARSALDISTKNIYRERDRCNMILYIYITASTVVYDVREAAVRIWGDLGSYLLWGLPSVLPLLWKRVQLRTTNAFNSSFEDLDVTEVHTNTQGASSTLHSPIIVGLRPPERNVVLARHLLKESLSKTGLVPLVALQELVCL